MKKYEASQELIDIFLKHGFIDKTENVWPMHFQRMQTHKYEPDGVKRVLEWRTHGNRNYIYFDYINVKVVYRHNIYAESLSFSEDELKSILVFFNLSTQDRWEWIKKPNHPIVSIYEYYQDILENPRNYNYAFDRRLKICYEKLIV